MFPQQKAKSVPSGDGLCCFHLRNNGHFDDTVSVMFKESVSGLNVFQGEGVGNERRGVELSLGQECEDFRNIAAIHPACLEGEVFPVHLRERKDLGCVIHRHNGDQGIGAGALPGQGKGILPASGFYDHISTPVLRMG